MYIYVYIYVYVTHAPNTLSLYLYTIYHIPYVLNPPYILYIYTIYTPKGVPKETFVRMTVDALATYSTLQPLNKITKVPLLDDWKPPTPIFGVQYSEHASDPYYSKKRVGAAWTVQRGFRVFRARKIASRKRYVIRGLYILHTTYVCMYVCMYGPQTHTNIPTY
jgi:hypothetical protein